jgi:hypothetical protein
MTKTIKFKEIDSNEENKKINEWVKQQELDIASNSLFLFIKMELVKNNLKFV